MGTSQTMWRGICLLVVTAGVAVAEVQVAPPPAAKKTVEAPLPDAAILNRLHADHVSEIRAARLAAQRTGSDQIRQWSDTLYRDSLKSDRQVRAWAGRLGVKLAPVPPANVAALQRLERLQGADFDRQFLAMLAQSRQASIKALEHQRFLLAKGSPMQDLLTLQLPKYRAHYDIAFHLSRETLQVADSEADTATN